MSEAETTVAPAGVKWGFGSAALLILAAIVTGQMLGTFVEGLSQTPGPFGTREWILILVLCGFALSLGTFLVLQRSAVARFFRTMQVGVTLVSFTLIAVTVGVLVPQISNFEDSTERIPSIGDIPDATFWAYLDLPDERGFDISSDERARRQKLADVVLVGLGPDQRDRLHKYRLEFQAFRWAEGYFLYHLIRPYGIGMPDPPPLLPQMVRGLEKFEKKYGEEERQNREKTMRAALNGRTISQQIGASIREHKAGYRRAFDVSSALHLNRTYKSHWFATLLCLLFTGVAFNTFKGKPASWLSTRKVGYVTVHMGVMTILVGGAWSKMKTTRGILQMDLRQGPTNEFWAYQDPKKLQYMPFWLKLDRFARRDWKMLEVVFPSEEFTSNPPQYTLWPGRKVDFDFAPDAQGADRPRIRIEVLSMHERARALPSEFTEATGTSDAYSIGPLAELSVVGASTPGDGDPPAEETVMLAPAFSERRIWYDPAGQFRLRVHAGGDLDAAVQEARTVDEGRLGWLSMRVGAQGDVEPTVVPIHENETLRGPGGYTIQVVRAVPTFQLDRSTSREIVDTRPLSQQIPANPAVIVRIQPEGGGPVEERPVLERFDYEAAGLQKGFEHEDLVINLQWDPWNAPGPERRVLHWDATSGAHLIAPDGSPVVVELGRALALPGATRVTPVKLFANARLERRVEFDPQAPAIEGPHFDSSFYSTDPTGAQVRVTLDPDTPQARAETVDMASTNVGFANAWFAPDKRFYLSYFDNDRVMPFEWRSVLSVLERDADNRLYKKDVGAEAEREIRVNDYFHYRGYRFFQSNANPQFPTYSGIGVVYDPGIPIVLLGMYLTILGTIIVFIIRPITESYGRRRQKVA